MSNNVTGIISLLVAISVVALVLLVFVSYIYSRIIFNGYLKKYYRESWEKMVYNDTYQGLNIFSLDKTPSIRKFRCESEEDYGDKRIKRVRNISLKIFNIGIIIWLCLVVIFVLVGIVSIMTTK